jgi:hypothetical protein
VHVFDQLGRVLSTQKGIQWIAIAIASVLVTSIASVGQVNSRADDPLEAGPSVGEPGDRAGVSGESTITTAAGAGTKGSGATPGSKVGGVGGTATTLGGLSGPRGGFPDWGLRTQGVTDKEVKLGISYNVSGCGDSGALEAMLGTATVGDYENSIDAYTRYVNDNGGIGGRKLTMVTADDGGGGCPEKALAGARKLVDDEKVFAVIPGLHEVSDYAASKHIPTFIGRDDPASLARIGANGIGLIQEIDSNLKAWAAFGRNYLDSAKHRPCLIHPEAGVSGDWPLYKKLLVKRMADQGLKFVDVVVYKEDVATAQTQSSAAAARLKDKKCDQVYFMAGNPIALIFFTGAAENARWYPQWTFTSYMVLSDTELAGRLMNQHQWSKAVGLSTRVKPGGGHPKEGNCKRIYEHYYPADGQSESASAQIACALILSTAEILKRGEAKTGKLDANALLVGADAITNDFYYDAHVPLDWRFPAPPGPYKTKGWSHYTPVKWNSGTKKYDFPEYPIYWQVMGPGKAGGIDLRPMFKGA